MSALVRKEIRLLLPGFAAALFLTLCVWLFPENPSSVNLHESMGFLFCAVVVLMALNSFGREMASGTFASLLTQPVPRSRLWWTKTLVLAGALVILLAAWWLTFLTFKKQASAQETHGMEVASVLFALAVYSGGLWSVLLLRQIAAAFWLTLLAPAFLALITEQLTEKFDAPTEGWQIGVLVFYSLAGFLWARRLFLRAQDVQWTGGTVTMPGLGGLRGLIARGQERLRRPRAALVAKEFGLHQSQFVIAVVLVVLHLGVIAARNIGDGFKDSPMLEFFVDGFWVFWLVMPLLIGCTAVAEERKLGTLETQLCLPARRRTQFLIKFSVALGLAILFGVAAPVLLEGKLLPNLLPLLLISTVLVAIPFYASTLTRNTLQAISAAIVGIVLGMIVFRVITNPIADPSWHGPLIYIIGIPTLTVAVAWLAYWNFKRVFVGWPIWRRNLLVLTASLAAVIVATSAIYHRVWELLSAEPRHGAARLKSPQEVRLRSDFANLVVQLPDGRVWTDRFIPTTPSLSAMLSGNWMTVDVFHGGRTLEGSSWTSVAVCYLDVAAVKGDGSLWVSEQSENPSMFWRQRNASEAEPIKLVRLGDDNDWKSVVGVSPPVFLLKTNGTLWRLGPPSVDQRKHWPGLRAFQPEQLGTNSNWAELGYGDNQVWLRKADGRTWVNGGPVWGRPESETLHFDKETTLVRAPYRDGGEWRGFVWASVRVNGHHGNQFEIGLRDDGTLRVRGEWRLKASKWEFAATNVQLGNDSNWVALAGNYSAVVTLKADGSLWKWDFPDDPISNPGTARAARLGSHSDWIGVVQNFNGTFFFSLAADGSLWLWQCGRRDSNPSEFALKPLLGPSRKPQRVGNVLAAFPQ